MPPRQVSEPPADTSVERGCSSADPCETLHAKLAELIKFQKRWNRATSVLYWSTSVSSILAAATATLLASLRISIWAAIAAATATVVAALEKALGLRDKWSHHRMVETELELVQLKLQTGEIGLSAAIAQIDRIARRYAESFPFGDLERDAERGTESSPPPAPAQT